MRKRQKRRTVYPGVEVDTQDGETLADSVAAIIEEVTHDGIVDEDHDNGRQSNLEHGDTADFVSKA